MTLEWRGPETSASGGNAGSILSRYEWHASKMGGGSELSGWFEHRGFFQDAEQLLGAKHPVTPGAGDFPDDPPFFSRQRLDPPTRLMGLLLLMRPGVHG